MRRFLPGGETVFLDGGRIAGVEAFGCEVPADCDVVAYPDSTVLRGLIDTHVYLVADGEDGGLERCVGYTDDDEIDQVRARSEQLGQVANVGTGARVGTCGTTTAIGPPGAPRASDSSIPVSVAGDGDGTTSC